MRVEQILRSAPVRVRFAGFESTTYELQRSGWELAIHYDNMRDSSHLALKHSPTGFTGISQSTRFDQIGLLRSDPFGWAKHVCFNIERINANTFLQSMHGSLDMNFIAIDATPQLVELPKQVNLTDLILFKPILAETELVVKPDDMEVRELLKIIESKQEITMKDVRERQRRRQARANLGNEVSGDRQIMAQIIRVA